MKKLLRLFFAAALSSALTVSAVAVVAESESFYVAD